MAPRRSRSVLPDATDYVPVDEPEDDRIIREAKKRFKHVSDWESTARMRFIEDVKFCNGDSDNLYQWPWGVRDSRGYGSQDERPCLTVNKTAQHCLQIVNDGRQNKTSVKIKPVGNGATYEAAQVMEGIVRHIEYISNAQSVYSHASTFQVQGGIGFCRLITDYADDESFDQEIYIRAIEDPLSVYKDPDHTQSDGSDMRFCFVVNDMPRDEFKIKYPKVEIGATTSVLGTDEASWIGTDKVRVAEYYYREEKHDELIVLTNPTTGETKPIKRSELAGMTGDLRAAFDEQLKDPATKKRPLIGHEVKCVTIAGDQIVDRKDWAGNTIPIAFAIGTQTVIDGELDRKGHVRALKDAQRIFNYNASADVEYGALQSKTPYLAPVAAIEELETYWERANLDNMSVLPWKHKDEDGGDIPPPERQQPPTSAPLYQVGMKSASEFMMMVSGQYQPMMGEPSNERSGKAITARQRQGENSTYHFIDHQAQMIRRLGKDIIDLIPKIYDTKRTIKIMGEDGSDSDIMLDPDAEKAYETRKAQTAEAAEQVIMNPTIGRYDVMSDVGPDFATRRQEAANALTQMVGGDPELMGKIGDLVFMALDFPLADEAAERLRRSIPAHLLGDGPDPQVAQLQSQLMAMGKLNEAISSKVIQLQSKATTSQEQKSVDVFKAVTERMKVIFDHFGIPQTMQIQMLHDLAMQEHQGGLGVASQLIDANLSSAQNDTSEAA